METEASQEELFGWVERTQGGPVVRAQQISGGNRARSWAVDVQTPGGIAELYLRYQPPRPPSAEPYTVWREAKFYAALTGSDVPAPRLVAVHPDHQAILTERARGRAEFRRLKHDGERAAIARDFIDALARLHRLDLTGRDIPGLTQGASMADCVRRELAVWRAMYEETGRADPLIDLALDWLETHVPAPAEPPVLAHGDAGPGNFLFDQGRMTALLDWELAHPGDPMEDLAWFSMRCVMEPVPDFAADIRLYARLSGRTVDVARIRYHRAFVSTRVTIIRHRNVTGLPGNSIVSRALNRRLLVTALAEAEHIALPPAARPEAPPTERTWLYDAIIEDMRAEIADIAAEGTVVAAAKNAAKVMKYLRDVDRLGATIEARDRAELAALLGAEPASAAEGMAALLAAMHAGRVSFADVIRFYAGATTRAAALAADASGGLGTRSFPPLPDTI